jgi:hypothetical protein
MPPTLLQRVVYTILTYLNAGSYYKTAEEIKNAFNIASLQLYKKLRGNLVQYAPGRPLAAINFEQTSATTDSLAEMYRVYYFLQNLQPFQIPLADADGRQVDIVQIIEAQYNNSSSPYRPVLVLPDNQFSTMVNNPVIPPTQQRPYGRLIGLNLANKTLSYEIVPQDSSNILNSVMARCLTLPRLVDFNFTLDTTKPLPIIDETDPLFVDTDWSDDKYDQLVFMTVEQLGFNISNGVLIQAGLAQEQKVL